MRLNDLKNQLISKGWFKNEKGRWKHSAKGARTFTLRQAAKIAGLWVYPVAKPQKYSSIGRVKNK